MEIIPNGTEVLIFNRLNMNYKKLDDTKFIKGTIIDSEESSDLSFNGNSWHILVYTVMGEDKKIYKATYNCAYLDDYFIRTIDDHIKHLKYSIENNNNKIYELNEENCLLHQTLNTLIKDDNYKYKNKRLVKTNKN